MLGDMSEPPSHPSRRTFLSRTAGAGAIGAGLLTSGALAGCQRAGAAAGGPGRPAARRAVPENSKPGDPNWHIRHLGRPDAIMGYAAPASVLPGEPARLFASTTSREFTVTAFRIGWYRGDLARRVWRAGPGPPAAGGGDGRADQDRVHPVGRVADGPDRRLAGGRVPAAAGRRVGG